MAELDHYDVVIIGRVCGQVRLSAGTFGPRGRIRASLASKSGGRRRWQ